MAGYIMTIGADEYLDMFYVVGKNGKPRKRPKNIASSKELGKAMAKQYALENCILRGVYSAKSSDKGAPFIGTLADYLGMKAGDSIFFFTERKIFGIGELVNIEKNDCRFRIHSSDECEDLVEERNPDMHHFVCTFRPSPFFFKNGVDMDEVLLFSPEKIRSLRFFSGMTFIKLDDIECEAIKNIIARKNEEYLDESDIEAHFAFDETTHKEIGRKILQEGNSYDLNFADYAKYSSNGNIASEYYIEGAVMDLLRNYTSTHLGKWDFVGRQYPASPPKPSEYEEAMDLFGYRYVQGFPGAISKYLVIELKVGTINLDNVQQTMKYVDWISREYTRGDYSMIEAYTIGYDKDENIEVDMQNIVERNYIIEGHPIESRQWHNLRIMSYCTLLNELEEKTKRNEKERA